MRALSVLRLPKTGNGLRRGDCLTREFRQLVPLAFLPTSRDLVTVFAFSPDRGFYIEGRAIVLGRGRGPNHFKVRFLGERLTHDRYVHPDWQAHPTRALKLLQDFWSAQKSPDPDDFFPPE